jgi:Cdc6-like AAA superfamily ATPase
MVIEDTLQVAGFSQMPFRIVPPAQMDQIVWAGDKAVIDELYEAAQATRADNLGTTEFIVVYGEYGSGKTNALKWLVQRLRADDQLVAYLVRPSILDKPTWHDIARSLFTHSFQKADCLRRLNTLRQWILRESEARARSELGQQADDPDRLKEKKELKEKELYGEILPDAPGFVQFAVEMADPSPSARDNRDRNWSYLADTPSRASGSAIATRYGLPSDGFGSDYSATLLLSSFITAMTYKTPLGSGSQLVALLMDEMEGLIELPPASRLSIHQGLRELINSCTEHLFIAIAATASDASEMWGILDNSLMQRLSRQTVQMPQLEEGEARQFILDIMSLNRTPNYAGPIEWPFSDDGLDAFVQMCPRPLTPRKLLVSAQRLIFQSYRDKVQNREAVTADDVRSFQNWSA